MAFIELEGVSFGYTDMNGSKTDVIKELELKIEKGSFVTILGRNGSGKSTVAKIINGLLEADKGRVCVDGIFPDSPENIWEIRKKVGMIFQNPDNQIVESVVEWDVAFGCENLGIPPDEIRKRTDKSLSAVGMFEHKESICAYLSGGEKQRVAIAGVIAMKPQCVIFDESTAMLDPKGRKDVVKIMKELNSEGITVVNITHFMEEALEGERVIVIDGGKKVKDGTPEEIFSNVEYMKGIKLDVPQMWELAYILRKKGYNIPKNVSNAEELANALKNHRYKKNPLSEKKYTDNERENILSLKNVCLDYGKGTVFEKAALTDVSMNIEKGGFMAVIGHTGSGKSTLMQCLNGLLKIDGGSVEYCGKDIYSDNAAMKEARKNIGSVFQYPEYQLFEATVYDDAAFAPKNMGLSDEETKERVSAALAAVGIGEEYFERSPFTLSGGEKRRIAIAGILAMNPQVLVLDEPAAALDPEGKREILGYIKNLHEEKGITVVIVSHSMEDAAKYADTITVMNGGKAVMSGKCEEIFENDLSKFGLGIPKMKEVADYFRKIGFGISNTIYDTAEMAEEIARHFETDPKTENLK